MRKKILFIITTFLTIFCVTNAQDTFTIADGITVETTGGTYIQLAGDLVETGTGYLKGTVTSGARTGETSFAGLDLSSGMDGTITRITGTSYAKGNGEGTNLLRYYELNNTGSAITPNVDAAIVTTGTHDEQNSLTGPYFVYNYDDPNWSAYGDGESASPVAGNSVALAVGTNDLVISEGVKIALKVYLEGPYAGSGAMNTTINASIPLTSPYNEDPRTVTAIPATAVDWVLAEVRDAPTGSPLGYRSCFLKSDGRLIADDGSNDIGLSWMPGSYHVVIRHRNHLAIMNSAPTLAATWGGTPTPYDFTTAQAQAYKPGAPDPMKDLGGGAFAMFAGDADFNGSIDATDLNSQWRVDNGQPWTYLGTADSDFNLNLSIDATDLNAFWRPNNGNSSQVP